MKDEADPVELALAASTRDAVRSALGRPRPELSLPRIVRLTRHLVSLPGAPGAGAPLRLAFLRTYATELLDPYLAFETALWGFESEIYHGPFGSVLQEAGAGSGLAGHAPDVVYVLLQVEDLNPSLAGPLSLRGPDERRELAAAAAETLHGMLSALRSTVPALLVATLLPHRHAPELGAGDATVEDSEAALRHELKRAVAERVRSLTDAVFHDLDGALTEVGRRRFFDPRLWHSSRFPFTPLGAQRVVRELVAYAVRLRTNPIKCIALDADNTLWGGIVGEDGPSGIALGPEYPGSLFVEFQRRLLALRQRGVLLALCSKNNEADVLEILREHPHQVLREEHFAALHIGWEPKPEGLAALAAELNLGLDAFLFVDDSPHECHAVRTALPAVEVIQVPTTLLALPALLEEEPRLELLSLTAEDRQRAEMYAQDRQRRAFETSATSVEDYLRSLQMVMTVRVNDEGHLPRIAQLTQKTNQFNLTTRRYSESEVAELMRSPGSFVASFSLADVLGDSGIVGVAIVRGLGSAPEIDTFLMSCRVIGRRAEVAFLRCILATCAERGCRRLAAAYEPTPKNGLVAGFWAENGFEEIEPGRYEGDLEELDSDLESLPVRVHVEIPRPPNPEAS